MKYPLAEQWKASLAIALSFDQFQLRHVSLDHAVIDRGLPIVGTESRNRNVAQKAY